MGKTNYPIKLRISASTPPFLFFSPLSLSPSFTVVALPRSTDPTLSHIHTNTLTNATNMLPVSHTLTLSALPPSDWIPFHSWALSNSLWPSLSLTHTHTHSLSHTLTHTPSGRNPAVWSCSALDMPDRLLWGGRFVCKNLFLIHSLIWVLMWANVGPAWTFFTPCDGLFWSFVPSDLLMLYFGYI